MASASNNEFGWNLLSHLSKEQGKNNLFLSPFSISVALAMTRLGAKGDTADGMEKALCWKADGDAIHKEFQQYITFLQKPNDSCILRTANRIYIEKRFSLLEDFLKKTKEFYLAEPISANFTGDAEGERVKINTWVEDQTEKKIKALIQAGVLDNLIRMVLVNAVYFKGKWKHQFDKQRTRPQKFHLSASNSKDVPMMHMKENLPYHKASGYAVLDLPYKGGQLSMSFFLPDDKFGLEAFMKELTMEKIKDSLSQLDSKKKVEVSLPKFEISSSFMMKPVLTQLGMAKAFSIGDADFSGMTGNCDLFISAVVHKAFLKVDEEGSEAAAATAVVTRQKCAKPMKPPITFIADHPFLVVIRDKEKDMILFIGQVTEPFEPK